MSENKKVTAGYLSDFDHAVFIAVRDSDQIMTMKEIAERLPMDDKEFTYKRLEKTLGKLIKQGYFTVGFIKRKVGKK